MKEYIGYWWRVLRVYSLPASMMPVLLGNAYAFAKYGKLNLLVFLAMAAASALIHMSTNLFNDYYDYKRGLDTEESVTLGGGIVHDGASPKQIFNLAIAMDVVAVLLGVYLCIKSSWVLALWGLLFLAIGYLYTGGPIPIAYLPIGECMSGMCMGAGITCIACYVQTGSFTWDSMMVAVPMILLIGLIMATNNIRDRVGDAKNGRRTIPILLGHNTAVRLALISFILVYVWPFVLMVKYHWLPFVLLPIITVKSAVTVVKIIWQEGKEPMEMMPAVQTTAQLVFSYGALYLVGLLLAV